MGASARGDYLFCNFFSMRTLEKDTSPNVQEIGEEIRNYAEIVAAAKNRRILLAMLDS